jgi:ssDNA-binding Zn-finger/Zn-ribbon topoisomerase 1
MFCSHCGYGQLPSDAPCCYVCGNPGPYVTQPLFIERRAIPRLPGECPKCRSRNTVSGSKDFNQALSTILVLCIVTVGVGLIFAIPYMIFQAATGAYAPNRYWCVNCKHVWNE